MSRKFVISTPNYFKKFIRPRSAKHLPKSNERFKYHPKVNCKYNSALIKTFNQNGPIYDNLICELN
jgi:hypothetical protein